MKLTTPILALACGLLSSAPALAETATDPNLIDLQSVTCEQFARALAYANPGDAPTEDAQALAIEAQDDLVLAMMWVNGYLTGRDGADGAHTFNQDWVVLNIGRLTEICKTGGSDMQLSDAAAKL